MRALALERREELGGAVSGGRACRRGVGKRRRDACHEPSGFTRRGPAIPQRGVPVHERGEDDDGARLGDGVRVVDQDELTGRLGDAAVQVGGIAERRCVLDQPRTVRVVREAAGHVRDQDDLVDLRREGGQRLGQLLAVPVGDDDRGDHAQRLAVDGERAARSLIPGERLRPLEPGGDEAVAVGERRCGSPRPGRRRIDGGVARDLAQRGLVGGDHRQARGHRLQHRQPEPLVAGGQDECGRAAVEAGELVLVDVAAHVRAERLELARQLRLALRPGDDEREPDVPRRARGRERVLPRLHRADVQQVAAAGDSPKPSVRVEGLCPATLERPEAGSTPCGVTAIRSGGTP